MTGEISENNVILHELIGLQATITSSPCTSLLNRTGRVVDETMNTFSLECNDQGKLNVITVPKHTTKFEFTIPTGRLENKSSNLIIELDGSILTKRPEDRIKKLVKIANKQKQR